MAPHNPQIRKILASITPREREILKERFGITISSDPTTEELKALYEVTRARIEEFEEKARKSLPGDDDPEPQQ